MPVVAPGETQDSAVTIADLNDAVKGVVEQTFPRVWIRGEVTGFKRNRGHWYFSMRDETAQVSCVVWNTDQWAIPATPDEGMQVVALAQVTVWKGKGSLQLRVSRIEAAGDGLWRKAMRETVDRLKAEGLLDPARKRALPRYPRCIAVVTSSSGAAVRDIIAVAGRRLPGIRLVISPAIVQGEGSALSICTAIERVSRLPYVDVVIVGRGGGSTEDMWAFNDERVARAIVASRAPVISAVGHETDTTVCDLVADVRAATPSAAAETAVPAIADLVAVLEARRKRLTRSMQRRGDAASFELARVAREMRSASLVTVDRRRSALGNIAGRLNALSPLGTLERGYAVARSLNGETLSSASQFLAGARFRLTLRDGDVRATVDRGSGAV